jgi:hypothetical protein
VSHDAAYKTLFSYPEVVEEFLRIFVPALWVDDVDFSTLTQVDAQMRGTQLEPRSGDCLYRFSLRDRPDCVMLVLIEFQATNDYMMAARINSYQGLLLDKLSKGDARTKPGDLPFFFPIVLYTGNRAWRGPTDVGNCVNSSILRAEDKVGWAHWPCVTYFLVDASAYGARRLAEMNSMIAWVLGLEVAKTAEEARRLANRLKEWLYEDGNDALQRDAAVWFNLVFRPGKGRRISADELKKLPLMEVRKVIAENIKLWEEDIKAEGRAEGERLGLERGRQEGVQEGKQEGERIGRNAALRETAKAALETPFGQPGVAFWIAHFEGRDIGPWQELIVATLKFQTLAELARALGTGR